MIVVAAMLAGIFGTVCELAGPVLERMERSSKESAAKAEAGRRAREARPRRPMKASYPAARARFTGPSTDDLTPFVADEPLRFAFAKVLDELADSEDPTVLVHFTTSSDLTRPTHAEQAWKMATADPKVRAAYPAGNVPLLEAWEPSVSLEKRRRTSFIETMSKSFAAVAPTELVRFVDRSEGDTSAHAITFEIKTHIHRGDALIINSRGPEVVGLTWQTPVDWTLRIVDRDGTELYRGARITAYPAWQLRWDDPNPTSDQRYELMTDSAYYDASRELVARFGLPPPMARNKFSLVGPNAAGERDDKPNDTAEPSSAKKSGIFL